ncbi:MAG: type II toxin-antitoxin system Phd/YefM family antitoxin [Brevundimonas sp.]|uniref:type II toxin-antitoxin system Phd/YefM family antitoxin n=1 Tax=Brevundimonas sp. TaxID=1871086 RepID=UPI0025C55ECB|nr:type II toxin-antitoxin system prevent-host-death family antitoxin [Brevundimonas sp.]MBX3478074.1 type II toxin-antitoxin system Phd/YefM family antitoxin [Brevundimonas sp.]
MTTVNVHEAKTHFSRLLERAAGGETVIIARAGKPVARLAPLEPEPRLTDDAAKRRVGFMKGEGKIPDDIKTPFAEEIEEMFYGRS